ncbi:MAG: YjjG family noncanonical pyrimidine nucleotidase [Lachnospiraceae bacterium]|nr:YjjG family noncanonical pyrimidine nucleotidase [Lachnospiraceae bacterium]
MRYTTLLLDADDTLLDFKKTEEYGLSYTFEKYGIPFTEEVRTTYKTINHKLWAAFEEGEISKPTILARRFRNTFAALGIQGEFPGFEEEYQLALGRGGFLIPEAMEVCQELSKNCRLYIVTNGVQATQASRMELSGLLPYIQDVFVSETTGYQKPQREYFDYVFSRIPDFDPEKTLMIGDSLGSDIKGGHNAGLDTCWYNPAGKTNGIGVPITHEIKNLKELYAIVKGSEE